MKRINTLFKRILSACLVAAFAASVCAAQTPAGNQQQPEAKGHTPAPGTEQAADKNSPLEEELSRTPAGKTVARFLAAFNSGDLKVMRAFHESFGGDPENAEKDKDFYEQTGGLKPHSLTGSAKDKIAVLVQTKKDARWLNFEFGIDAQEPHGISSIKVSPATAPAAN